MFAVDEEEDINKVLRFFSYEHFYVVYCKFWELDTDHDFLIDKARALLCCPAAPHHPLRPLLKSCPPALLFLLSPLAPAAPFVPPGGALLQPQPASSAALSHRLRLMPALTPPDAAG